MKQKLMSVSLTCGLALASMLTLAGCEQTEDDKIASAQACLDSATNETVASCEALIEGVSGAAAAAIRCSANFIYQSVTADRMSAAFLEMTQNTSNNETLGMMSYLTFTVGSSSNDIVNKAKVAVTNCTESGYKSMIMLANSAKAATVLLIGTGVAYTPGTPPTPSQIQAALASFSDNGNATDAELGESAVAISDIYCGSTSATKDARVCSEITSAVAAGTSYSSIGAQLRALLASS